MSTPAADLPVIVAVGDGLLRPRVLDRAVAEAVRERRPVLVLHVHAGPHETWEGDAGVRAEVYLGRTAPEVHVVRRCEVGDPARLLAVASRDAALVVLGDRRPRLGVAAGRTTAGLLERTACPLLVTGEYRVPAGRSPHRDGVVVGLDGGPADPGVLIRAAAADPGRVPVEILDAAPSRPEPVALAGSGHPAELRRVPPGALLDVLTAEAHGADLVVVGLPATDRASVLRLVAAAPGPVLLVPPPVAPPAVPTPREDHAAP